MRRWLLGAILPLALIVGAAVFGAALLEGTVLYRTGRVLGPALVATLLLILSPTQRIGSITGIVVLGGTVLSGIWGWHSEWQRWAGKGYPAATVFSNLDVPLIMVASYAVLVPFWSRLPPVWLWGNPHSRKAETTAFGSARWMTLADAKRRFASGPLIIGAAYDAAKTTNPALQDGAPPLKFAGSGHLLTVGGSGSGKTRTIVRPNCLHWPGPLVVLDPKGDLGRDCGPAREQKLGHRILILNPHDPATDAINVLDWLDPDRESLLLDVESVISWIMDGRGTSGQNAVFEGRARALIGAAMVDMMCDTALPAREKTLRTLHARLRGEQLGITLSDMETRPDLFGWGLPRAVAREMNELRLAEETWQGVAVFVSECLAFLNAPTVANMLSGIGRTVVRTADLLRGDIDVFISVPARTLTTTPAIARLVLGGLLNVVYEQMHLPREQRREVLFLLDEMPRLGGMKILETARDLGRESGVRLWAVVQDLSQLKKAYGDPGWTSWLESTVVQTFIGINDYDTAKRLADMLGQRTVEMTSRASGRDRGGLVLSQQNVSVTTSKSGAYLITPDQILQMATDAAGAPSEQIVRVSQQPPLRCGVVRADRRSDLLT